MKKEFKDYLISIGLSKPVILRIDIIMQDYQKICPEEILDIFVSEYLTADGTRNLEGLWFFSEKYLMEAKNFIIEDDFDITPFKSRIQYVQIRKKDFMFGDSSESSRFNLGFSTMLGPRAELKASQKNCEHLSHILFKCVLPNLVD